MVGDGFPVRSIFSYHELGVSPFLLLDYAGPGELKPSKQVRGVGEHPHRGFETVTIVYSGELTHRDSTGAGGKIGPGDVQWMTAASGVVHEEKYSKEFTEKGGRFEFVQLWVNLPAKDKMSPPRYQGLSRESIPVVEVQNGSGQLRVIAGEYKGARGPARTFTPIEIWDLRLSAGVPLRLGVAAGHTTLVFVLAGEIKVDGQVLSEAEIGVLDRVEEEFELTPVAEARVLILAGEPIGEPVVGHGPFVMNTSEEVMRAFQDYESGKMGRLPPVPESE